MSGNQNDKLIERSSSDSSAQTKQVTYWGEVVDFTQFTCMTGLSDVLNAFLQRKGKEIPVFGMTGLDVFSYALMVYLANLRTDKFADRNALLNDQNQDHYYQKQAQALYDSLNVDEKAELFLDKPKDMDDQVFIIELLQFNAELLNPHNLPAARTQLHKWRAIFERVKKRPVFVQIWYGDVLNEVLEKKQFTDSILKEQLTEYSIKDKTLEQIELDYIRFILNRFSLKVISEQDARYFHTKLKILESFEENEVILSKHLDLLEQYGVPRARRHEARRYFTLFYDAYHARQDKNDKAFYKANMRGIQSDENTRTWFKTHFFHGVRDVSAVGLAYSIVTFGTSVVYELLKKDPLPLPYLVAPLFLVGFTSLVDEATDLYFKSKKYWESKSDLEQWESVPDNQAAIKLFPELLQERSPAINRFCLNPANAQTIRSHYLGAKSEDEEFDPQVFGEKYLKAKYQEHKEIQDRFARRGTKLFQACLSFTGVFFGVLISWAVSILAMAYDLPGLKKGLSFAGFGTILTAGVGGSVMVAYQRGQNNNKIAQAQARETELLDEMNSQCPDFDEYLPTEEKLMEERGRLQLVTAI